MRCAQETMGGGLAPMIDAGEIVVESEFKELAEKKPLSRVVIDLIRKQPLGAKADIFQTPPP